VVKVGTVYEAKALAELIRISTMVPIIKCYLLEDINFSIFEREKFYLRFLNHLSYYRKLNVSKFQISKYLKFVFIK
jgi:hypothetical protein